METNQSNRTFEWWYWWNCNIDPFAEEESNWLPFSKEDGKQIELAYSEEKETETLTIANKVSIIDFKNYIQILESNKKHRRPIKRTEKESNYEIEFGWFVKCYENQDHNNDEYLPYDTLVDAIIENSYQNNQKILRVEIEKEIYIIDLNNNLQILEKDTTVRVPITRAHKHLSNKIIRENRFWSSSSANKNNIITNYEKKENIQVLNSIKNIIKGTTDFILTNKIFDKKISLTNEIMTYLDKINFPLINNINDLKEILKEEIKKEAKSKQIFIPGVKINLKNPNDFQLQEEKYNSLITQITEDNIEETVVRLYTEEGFIYNSVNSVLKNKTLNITFLYVYILLLQSSFQIIGSKYNTRIIDQYSNNIQITNDKDGENYINLFRFTSIDKEILIEHEKKLKESKQIFILFNEFLSSIHDYENAVSIIKGDSFKLKEGYEKVLFRIQINSELIKSNSTIVSFIEDLSKYPNEKEVLFSSSSIFQITNIQLKKNLYQEVTLKFAANGSSPYEFIKYSSLELINLDNSNVGEYEAKSIADSLKTNSSLLRIDLNNNNIGDEGLKAISIALKANFTLKVIHLDENNIEADGARAISEVLKTNFTIESIHLSLNKIGNEGTKAIAEAIKYNTNLKKIFLLSNNIGAEGAKAISDILIFNSSLKQINLDNNKIGNDGAKWISEAITFNTHLQEINLNFNSIGDVGAEKLYEAIKINTHLKLINLISNNIGEKGCAMIAESLKFNSTLQVVNLNRNNVGDAGIKAIALSLKINTKLEGIHLNSNGIGIEGAKAMAEALAINSGLKVVYMNNNIVGDKGEQLISEALKSNDTLQAIYLYCNNITANKINSDERIKNY